MRAFILLLMVVTTSGAAVSEELLETLKQQGRLPGGSMTEPPTSRGPLIDCTYGVACPIVAPGWSAADVPEDAGVAQDGVNATEGLSTNRDDTLR